LKREQRETTTKLAEIDKTLSSLMNAIQILQKQKGGATASQVEPVGEDIGELRQKMEETAQSVQQMQYSIDDLKMLMTESSGKSGMGTDGKTTKALETRIKSLEN
jgi:predicted  nucleic acid-binding Zn-ribbon protein